MRESKIEKYFCDKCDEIGWLQYKFKSPGHKGVPDRIIIIEGCVCFVEFKAPGIEPDPAQIREHMRIEQQGISVFVIDSREAVDQFFAEHA